MKTIVINDATFNEQVLKNDHLTIVDFWAPWCRPCTMIAPVLEHIAEQYEGQVKITKLNVDENPAISQAYGIFSIPTLLFFDDGRVVDKLIGAVPKSQLEIRINRLLRVTA
jgi:thioredoxin 1